MTSEQIQAFLKKHGDRGAKVMERLGTIQSFVEAIGTELGKELLGEYIKRYNELLNYVCEKGEKTEPEKLIELRIVDFTILEWSRKICYYNNKIREIGNG